MFKNDAVDITEKTNFLKKQIVEFLERLPW